MIKIRLSAVLALVTFFPLPGSAQMSDNYRCAMGDMIRRVEIVREPGVAVPCEVHYYKDTESPGDRQVLWRAQNDAGYCESKTQEFVAMLGGMDWQCTASDSSVTAPAEEAPVEADDAAVENETENLADDTEALAPADPKN